MSYILIHDEPWTIDTAEEIAAAMQAMTDAGMAEAEVWVGDPDGQEGDTYKNGQKLFA